MFPQDEFDPFATDPFSEPEPLAEGAPAEEAGFPFLPQWAQPPQPFPEPAAFDPYEAQAQAILQAEGQPIPFAAQEPFAGPEAGIPFYPQWANVPIEPGDPVDPVIAAEFVAEIAQAQASGDTPRALSILEQFQRWVDAQFLNNQLTAEEDKRRWQLLYDLKLRELEDKLRNKPTGGGGVSDILHSYRWGSATAKGDSLNDKIRQRGRRRGRCCN